jgi:O-antigen/teichoic acid export membrane protein
MSYEDETPEEVQELGLSTAKKGVIYIGGEIATSVITLFLLIFLARILQPAEFGIYAIAIAFNAILSIASNFGVGSAFRKMIPEMKLSEKTKIGELLSNGYFIVIVIGLAIAIAGVLASGYIAVNIYNNSALVTVLEIAAVAELFSALFNLTQGALVGLGLVKEATIANAAYSILYLVGSVALVLLGYGVVGAVSGLLIGLLLGTLIGYAYVIKKTGFMLIKPTKAVMKRLTDFSLPVVTSYVATQGAQNFSVLLLGVYAAAAVVGNYGAAFKLARFVEIIITAITFILLGAFAEALAKKTTKEKIGEIYNNSIYYSALFLFPLIAYSVSVAQPITNILFGATYATAPLYFAIIVVGMALGLIALYAGTLIVSNGDTKKFMRYQVGAVILQLILLFVLTPIYQALGVLLALYLITPIALNILYMKALEEQFKFKHKFGQLARITIVSILLGLLLYYISYFMHQSKWSLVINAVVLVLLFPPLAVITKGITRKNLEFVQNTGKRLMQLRIVVDWLVKYAYIFARE